MAEAKPPKDADVFSSPLEAIEAIEVVDDVVDEELMTGELADTALI